MRTNAKTKLYLNNNNTMNLLFFSFSSYADTNSQKHNHTHTLLCADITGNRYTTATSNECCALCLCVCVPVHEHCYITCGTSSSSSTFAADEGYHHQAITKYRAKRTRKITTTTIMMTLSIDSNNKNTMVACSVRSFGWFCFSGNKRVTSIRTLDHSQQQKHIVALSNTSFAVM